MHLSLDQAMNTVPGPRPQLVCVDEMLFSESKHASRPARATAITTMVVVMIKAAGTGGGPQVVNQTLYAVRNARANVVLT